MKPTRLSKLSIAFDDGTTWPRVDGLGEVHGLPERQKELVLCHYAGAFVALVCLPERRRNEVIRALRKAEREPPRDALGERR